MTKDFELRGRCLAVIPARGGSQRVPGKNIRCLRGRPMIEWTIEAARASGVFGRVVVSTDSDAIARIAENCGAEVPFLRNSDLADNHTPVSAATVDALERIDPEGKLIGFVSQLMANCPLRTAADIQNSWEQFRFTRASSQVSVTPYGWQNPWWAMERLTDMSLRPVFPDRLQMRSQDLPEIWCPTGAIWWATAETLRRHRTFHVHGRKGWEIPWPRGIDIDTPEDFELAGLLMASGAAANHA